MARKVIIEEPNALPGLTLLGIAALILALGIAFYFERQAKEKWSPTRGQVESKGQISWLGGPIRRGGFVPGLSSGRPNSIALDCRT
jgi:hypothetical protein